MIYLQVLLVSIGCLFFVVGTLGLLRFPDTFSRIHAITKADNLGLGFIVIGVLPSLANAAQMGKALLAWLLVLAASATSSYLIAHYVRTHHPSSLPHARRDESEQDAADDV